MYRILSRFLILISSILVLLIFTDSGYCISAPGAVTGWVRSFPLRDDLRQIDLEWAPVAGAIEYRVYRSSFAKGATPPITPPSIRVHTGTATTFTDTGLSNDHWYIYQVTAFDGTIESTASPEKSYGIFVPAVRLKWEEIP